MVVLLTVGFISFEKIPASISRAGTPFSQKAFFALSVKTAYFHGYITDKYFVDIGITSDYQQACKDLQRTSL
jgi:NDP-sugar pyrophosphorylase family protein